MGEILDFAELLWKGEVDTRAHHPLSRPYGMDQIDDKTWFFKGFANTIIRETDQGLVIVDPGGFNDGDRKFDAIRCVTSEPLHTAIYTHGHVDHCFGVSNYVKEAKSKAWPIPRVIAHEAMPARFRRYQETSGYNDLINMRQFQGGARKVNFPVDFYYPDITYQDRLNISVGDAGIYLRHATGETDDHTWVFFPDRGVLATGDLFFWCVPNAGNPQKFQRYCKGWAIALREMAALEPQILLPGHGWPIVGPDRVRQALDDTATLLESLQDQTIALMNQGASLNTIIHTVKAPEELLKRPYLYPVYDEPEFIVQNIWRLYGGWYDGTPSHLKPAPEQSLAEEIARLAGGADKLVARAEKLAGDGRFRLAGHLADWAYLAAQDDPAIRKASGRVYAARAEAEPSTMAMGVFLATAREMEGKDDEAAPKNASVFIAQDRRGQKA